MIDIAPPPGADVLPSFDGGWIVDGVPVPYLSYADGDDANWSEDLETLHEESSRDHFLDVWTREAILEQVQLPRPDGTIVDLGCSTGYLLEDVAAAYPDATLVGVDLVASGLRKTGPRVPRARLLQADVRALPLGDGSADVVVSANLLEHVQDDVAALREVRRVLRSGGRGVFVVPAGPSTYDYYDRFLGHERRYGQGELAAKARSAGLTVFHDAYLASLLYPAFWAVKKRNRIRYGHLRDEALERRVAADIAATSNSRIGSLLRRIETRLGPQLPFGIRNVVVVGRPA